MIYELRRPVFRVIITRPNYNAAGAYSESDVAVFRSDESNKILVSYNYRQDLAGFESPFSLTFVPEVLGDNGDTIMEKVKCLDVVKIEEYGKIKYMGLVNSRRYTATMTEGGPERMIVISGGGVGGILAGFNLLLDQVILADAQTSVAAMENALRAFVAELSGTYAANSSMTHIMRKIADTFRQAQEEIGGYPAGTGIYKVIDRYLQFSPDSDRLATKYPLALSVFSYGGSNLLQIWQELVFKPFYEFFIRWDEPSSAYLLHLRPTPFDPEAWLQLPKTILDPVRVSSIDLGYTDSEVKTWFFAYLAGGALSYENARYNAQAVAIERDPSRWALYGYRPLEASFKYVDYEGLRENGGNITVTPSGTNGDVLRNGGTVSDETLMSEYSKKMKAWFSQIDEMASGTIVAMTVQDMPQVGERLEYNGVEFYVEAIDGSWQDGAEMKSSFSVTRGGVYNRDFNAAAAENAANWWFRQAKMNTMK